MMLQRALTSRTSNLFSVARSLGPVSATLNGPVLSPFRRMATSAGTAAQKYEWLVIVPDKEGAEETRLRVRSYALSFFYCLLFLGVLVVACILLLKSWTSIGFLLEPFAMRYRSTETCPLCKCKPKWIKLSSKRDFTEIRKSCRC